MCVLDQAPWAYTSALLVGICCRLLYEYRPFGSPGPLVPTLTKPPERTPNIFSTGLRHGLALLAATVILRLSTTTPSTYLPPQNDILSIIVLTAPRPLPTLEVTLTSYISLISQQITLTAYTRSESLDVAFSQASEVFSNSSHSIPFIRQKRAPEESADLYSDAAGLFTWAHGRSSEWTMIVEDDFPLCPGPRGADAIRAVLSTLESRRKEDEACGAYWAWPRAGWVGTGGSGLIFHRSILPAVAHALRTPPPTASTLSSPSGENQSLVIELRAPPDVIMQRCALRGQGMGCGSAGAVISARLAMHHTGGGNSALKHLTPSERWQCNWRYVVHHVKVPSGCLVPKRIVVG
jgi:hypothetical protein